MAVPLGEPGGLKYHNLMFPPFIYQTDLKIMYSFSRNAVTKAVLNDFALMCDLVQQAQGGTLGISVWGYAAGTL